MIPAALLATLWFLPTVSAVGGFIVALLFVGDWTEALVAAAVLALPVLAARSAPLGLLPADEVVLLRLVGPLVPDVFLPGHGGLLAAPETTGETG